MKNVTWFGFGLPLFCAATALAQITPGNLVVARVGTGAAPLSNASTATFLDEVTVAGSPVQTIAMPTTATGLNLPFSNSGTATSEGFVTQSADGRFLVLAGYGTAPGLAAVSGTASSTVNRVIARVALDGTIDTTTALTDGYSGSNIRSATSLDGTMMWSAGTASVAANAGVRYTTLGSTTSLQLSATPTNMRVVNIDPFQNELFCSSATGTFQGISLIGTGLPTTAGQTTTLIPGFPTATGPSSYDFFFADAGTLYVADDRTNGSGGIQKWILSGGTATLAYTLAVTLTSGCRGLSGYVENGVATLFATTTQASGNSLVTVVDTGASSTFTTLATAAANTAFRGVRFVRTPASSVHSGVACPNNNGTPTVGTFGAPVIGNTSFAVTAGNSGALSFVLFLLKGGPVSPVGFPVPGTPPCVQLYFLPDVLLGALTDPLGAASTPLPLPPNSSLGGIVLGAQVAAFDLSLVGFDIPIGTSDALQITIGN